MLTARESVSIARSIRHRIDVCDLDLTGWILTTEAATGAYAATAAAAAAAGAEVWALAADSLYGSVAEARHDVGVLADALGVRSDGITIVTNKGDLPLETTDMVTNSGHLRPITASFIARLPPTAVIALMYEAWEARHDDIEYGAAARRGIRIIGVNEHHPACDAFRFLGDLVVAAVLRRRWPIRGMRVGVLSDNAFGEPVVKTLRSMGADARIFDRKASGRGSSWDLAVIATTPATSSADRAMTWAPAELADLVIHSDAFCCVQLWGDVDRDRLRAAGVMIEPETEPVPGHQGVAMSAAGFEAVIRLQVGGMAAALHGSTGGKRAMRGLSQQVAWSDR